MKGTPCYEQVAFLERKVAELEDEAEKYKDYCVQLSATVVEQSVEITNKKRLIRELMVLFVETFTNPRYLTDDYFAEERRSLYDRYCALLEELK